MFHPLRRIFTTTHLLVIVFFFYSSSSFTSGDNAIPDDIQVTVYHGLKPSQCSNNSRNKDGKPTKIEVDYTVGLHFTASVVGGEDDGRKVESSHDMGFAPSFVVGRGKVIAGLDKGLIGLCKNSKAHIIIPPHLAYGRYGKPEQGVHATTILQYDVEIIDIQPPIPNDFIKIDTNQDWKISKNEAKKYFDSMDQPIDIDSLWKVEDKDGDGYISWEEFAGSKGGEGPPSKEEKQQQNQQQRQQQQRQQQQQLPTDLFQKMDVDDDKRISKSELTNALKEVGEELTEESWARLDGDDDGYLTFVEFAGPGEQQQPPEQQQSDSMAEVKTLFQKMDADNDGRLSKSELGNALKSLGQELTEDFWVESDGDGDGYVSFGEFVGGSGGGDDEKTKDDDDGVDAEGGDKEEL